MMAHLERKTHDREAQSHQPNTSHSTGEIARGLARNRTGTDGEVKTSSAGQGIPWAWSLPHNAKAQQVNLLGIMTLSTGNLLHLFLLSFINPSIQYQSPFSDEQLNALRQNHTLVGYAQQIARGWHDRSDEHRTELRQHFRQVYASAASGGMPPEERDGVDDNWRNVFTGSQLPRRSSHPSSTPAESSDPDGDLPLQIANMIAYYYYTNLELTLDNVEKVITDYLPQIGGLSKITDAFIDKIVHARIDKGRYELLSLLPDKDFIKAAVEQLKGNNKYTVDQKSLSFLRKLVNQISNWWTGSKVPASPLQHYKDTIREHFDRYISWWKFSWFGHHHDKRARVVKAEIQKCSDVNEIRAILTRQKRVMLQKSTAMEPVSRWNDARWNYRTTLHNVPTKPSTSGYYKAITQALTVRPPSP